MNQDERFRAAIEHSQRVEAARRGADSLQRELRELEARVTALEKFLEHNGFVPSRVIEDELARVPSLQKRDIQVETTRGSLAVAEVERAAEISKATRASAPVPSSESAQTSAEPPLSRLHNLLDQLGPQLLVAKAASRVGAPAYRAVDAALSIVVELKDAADDIGPPA